MDAGGEEDEAAKLPRRSAKKKINPVWIFPALSRVLLL